MCVLMVQSPSLGTVSFSWRSDSVLMVRVVDARGIVPSTVDIGTAGVWLRRDGVARYAPSTLQCPNRCVGCCLSGFSVNGIGAASSAAGTTMPSTRQVITGTWGVPSAPSIVAAVARDGGGECGLSAGDSLTLVRIALHLAHIHVSCMRCNRPI